jgi:hypothetical protein
MADQVVRMTPILGHKASQRLIEYEAYRRIMSGELPATLDDFARELLDWFQKTYPGGSPITLKDVENDIPETLASPPRPDPWRLIPAVSAPGTLAGASGRSDSGTARQSSHAEPD